jgi:hypothetical protein
VHRTRVCTSSGRWGLSGRWWSFGGVLIAGCWSAITFGFSGTDSVIQLLEKCNKSLKLSEDIVGQGKGIFNHVFQAYMSEVCFAGSFYSTSVV